MELLTRRLAVDLRGNGNVARALQARLPHAGIRLAAVSDSKGPVWRDVDAEPTVLVDCTPPHYDGPAAAAWIARLDEALARGTPVVTCNKAPLALAWDRLHRHGTPLLCSATVGGGTPVLPTLARLRHAGIQRIDAVLNGTLGHVLRAVWQGTPLELAVRAAQAAGLAEPDPRIDLDGTDALAKATIIQNVVFGPGARRPLLASLPRLRIDEAAVQAQPEPPNLVVRITPEAIEWKLVPAPWAGTEPAAAAVRVHADTGTFQLTGPGAGPEATAANILADLRSLA